MSGLGLGAMLVDVKIEREAGAGLHAEHEVKDELVLSPEQLQPHYTSSAVQLRSNQDHTYCREAQYEPTYAIVEHAPKTERDTESTSSRVKEEPHDGAEELSAGAGLGRVKWKGQDVALATTTTTNSQYRVEICSIKVEQETVSQDAPAQSAAALRGCGACCVRLQRTQAHQRLHECPVCFKTFLHRSSLTTHVCIQNGSKVHKMKNMYICDDCKKHFSLKKDLIKHLKVHSRDNWKLWTDSRFNSYRCNICPKSFNTLAALLKHNHVHCNQNQCDIIETSKKKTLKTSTRHHTEKKLIPCDVCNKMYSKYYMPQHALIHTEEKPFSCDVCNKSYKHRSLLIQHKLIHTGGKPYICDSCNKSFTDHSNFMRHKLVHTKEQPYACHVCKKKFRHRANLNKHCDVIHKGEKPYGCDICEKTFTDRSSARRHLAIHMDLSESLKLHPCDVCPRSFRWRTSLTYHKQSHERC